MTLRDYLSDPEPICPTCHLPIASEDDLANWTPELQAERCWNQWRRQHVDSETLRKRCLERACGRPEGWYDWPEERKQQYRNREALQTCQSMIADIQSWLTQDARNAGLTPEQKAASMRELSAWLAEWMQKAKQHKEDAK